MSNAPSLFSRHQKIALSMAREINLPGGDRDDVRQEARIALWEAARAYNPDKSSFPTWARLVIRRHLMDCLRTATRQKRAFLTNASRDEQLSLIAAPDDWVREARELMALVNALPRHQRRAIVGVACGMSYDELGHRKEIDNALMRARRKLRSAA
jgi:RNA polymerase sigma-H factor